jgi:hypothetical protein
MPFLAIPTVFVVPWLGLILAFTAGLGWWAKGEPSWGFLVGVFRAGLLMTGIIVFVAVGFEDAFTPCPVGNQPKSECDDWQRGEVITGIVVLGLFVVSTLASAIMVARAEVSEVQQ